MVQPAAPQRLGHVHHHFWPDAISQITDTYLLALAVHHKGHLVTLDSRLQTTAVSDGGLAITLILEG